MPPGVHLLSARPHTQRQGWEGTDFEVRPAQVHSQPGRLPAADTLRLSFFSCGWGGGRGGGLPAAPMRPLLWAPLAAHGPPEPWQEAQQVHPAPSEGGVLNRDRTAHGTRSLSPKWLRCEG